MGSYGLRWIISGWWLKTTYPFEKYMTSSIGMMTIPTEWEHEKWPEPPTSFCLPCSSMLNYGSNETSLPEKMSCLRKMPACFPIIHLVGVIRWLGNSVRSSKRLPIEIGNI